MSVEKLSMVGEVRYVVERPTTVAELMEIKVCIVLGGGEMEVWCRVDDVYPGPGYFCYK